MSKKILNHLFCKKYLGYQFYISDDEGRHETIMYILDFNFYKDKNNKTKIEYHGLLTALDRDYSDGLIKEYGNREISYLEIDKDNRSIFVELGIG